MRFAITIFAIVCLLSAVPLGVFAFHKFRQVYSGTTPPWDPAYEFALTSSGRPTLVAAPWILFIGLFMPFTVMVEPHDPWYLPYTSAWFAISALAFSPAKWVVTALDLPPAHWVRWVVAISWAGLFSGLGVWLTKTRKGGGGTAA